MDSSSPSTSGCGSPDRSEAKNGEGLAVDEIMRMKKKRLRLLDDYRNEQEESILPLMREADEIDRKKRKKARNQFHAENNTPLRRSERILTQALNEDSSLDSPMHQPQFENGFIYQAQEEPESEPELVLMVEATSTEQPLPEQPLPIYEPGEEAQQNNEPEQQPLPIYEPGEEAQQNNEPEQQPLPIYEVEEEPQQNNDPEQQDIPMELHVLQPTRRGRCRFDVQLVSRRYFAVHPPPRNMIQVPPFRWKQWLLDYERRSGNSYGPIEGFDVGYLWNTRLECSHAKVHRPSMAGIHPGPFGAFSVALSGAYPEDIDEGNEVLFTGSGGRDLTATGGRSSRQLKDQELNPANVSLIRSFKTGFPVRLIRGYRLVSSFAPDYGYRYDGVYRVVHYSYDMGYSGFRVYRFKMCRIDPIPPPWATQQRLAIPDRVPTPPPERPQSPPPRDLPPSRDPSGIREMSVEDRIAAIDELERLDNEIQGYIRILCWTSFQEGNFADAHNNVHDNNDNGNDNDNDDNDNDDDDNDNDNDDDDDNDNDNDDDDDDDDYYNHDYYNDDYCFDDYDTDDSDDDIDYYDDDEPPFLGFDMH